jgi:hypothetical protein
MKELEGAISDSLSTSSRVAEVIAKINEEGFDAFLILEASVGLSRQKGEERIRSELVGTRAANAEVASQMNAQDVNFLKSLCIRVDDTP